MQGASTTDLEARTMPDSTRRDILKTAAALGPQLSSAGDKPLHKLSDPIEHEQPEKGIIPPFRAKRSAK